MKIKLATSLKEYHEKFCKTEGQRMWASTLALASRADTLEVLSIEADGSWKTNEKFLGFHIGIPPEEQHYFEVKRMTEVNIDLTGTFVASVIVPDREIGFVMGKLMEEVGEFAKSINQPERCDEEPLGEAADVINCVCDMLFLHYRKVNPGMSESKLVKFITESLTDHLDVKAAKWIDKACN